MVSNYSHIMDTMYAFTNENVARFFAPQPQDIVVDMQNKYCVHHTKKPTSITVGNVSLPISYLPMFEQGFVHLPLKPKTAYRVSELKHMLSIFQLSTDGVKDELYARCAHHLQK